LIKNTQPFGEKMSENRSGLYICRIYSLFIVTVQIAEV